MDARDTASPEAVGDASGEPVVVELSADDESVADSVVRAVARRSGRDPLALPPLQTVVDCDALDGLFGRRRGGRPVPEHVSVQFEYAGHTVTLADGRVVAE
jgi:hypothetical protein